MVGIFRWNPASIARRRLVVALVIGMAVFLLAPHCFNRGMAATPAPPQGNSGERALAQLVEERLAELAIPPKTIVMPTDQGLQTANEIKAGHYAAASRIALSVLASSRQHEWRNYPFDEYLGSIVRGEDPALLQHLDLWLAGEPNSTAAHLIRAMFYARAGSTARGAETADKVPQALMDAFTDDMTRSISDFRDAIRLNRDIPWSYLELERVSLHVGNRPVADQAFREGSQQFSAYFPLYSVRLKYLAPKWGGSIGAMYSFVDQYAGASGPDSPLKLLYLDLYVALLDAARFNCGGDRGQCFANQMARTVRPSLRAQIQQALNLYRPAIAAEFSAAIWPLLDKSSCPECAGSAANVGADILESAAEVMGSDNRMMDHPSHNSYVLDDITAHVWAQMGNAGNADKKYHEALQDVEQTAFAEPGMKADALAGIYTDMTATADNNDQFVDMIVYQDAANAIAGDNRSDTPWSKCYALYRLNHFSEAVTECTSLIDGHGNFLITHYWRAKAYEQLGEWDKSLADFAPVADGSDNWFRAGAALDMSYDLGRKQDYLGQLASMNAHDFIFDPKMQGRHDVAVAYNNRCFAQMQLGHLREALGDCTKSLEYDRLPDAVQKRQTLLSKLNESPEAGSSTDGAGSSARAPWRLYGLLAGAVVLAVLLLTAYLSKAAQSTQCTEEPVRRELTDGERLLWSGIPQSGLRLRPSDTFLIPFSLLWTAFAIFWEYNVLRAHDIGVGTQPTPWFLALWGVPFILIGLQMVIGRFFADAWMRARTKLAVTDRRILILTHVVSTRVRSLELRTLSEMNLQEGSGGRGTITFGPAAGMMAAPGWSNVNRRLAPAFEGIEQVRQVYETIQSAVKASHL